MTDSNSTIYGAVPGGTTSLIFLLALAAFVQPLSAFAQESGCPPRAQCRALGFFKTCDRPQDGARVFSARIMAVSRKCSHTIVSMRGEERSAENLPNVFEIDLGNCVSFNGNVGDVIQIALHEPPNPDVQRYSLACRIW